MKTKKSTQTVRIKIRQPSKRKKERINDTLSQVQDLVEKISNRMDSIPEYRWSNPKQDNTFYQWTKDSELHSAIRLAAMTKTVDMYDSWRKNDRKSLPSFKEVSWIPFTSSGKPVKYEENNREWGVKLPLEPYKPEWFKLETGNFQEKILGKIKDGELQYGGAELIAKNEEYYINQTYTKEIEIPENTKFKAGIDVGLKNIATLSVVDESEEVQEVEFFDGSEVAHYRDKLYEKRKEYQERGVDQKLEELSNLERRFVQQKNHEISRKIVNTLKDYKPCTVILEDLKGYRDNIDDDIYESTARVLHSWSFRQLQDMIEYKALEAGIPTRYVNPENTSKICNKCGEKGVRNGDDFYCQNCGYGPQVNADFNASVNIAKS